MANDAKPGYGIVMGESIDKFRALIDDDEKYTDEELANTLTFLGSLEVVFSALPPYLPPVIRASVVANEIAPKLLADLVECGAINPIALLTHIKDLAAKNGWKDDRPKFLN